MEVDLTEPTLLYSTILISYSTLLGQRSCKPNLSHVPILFDGTPLVEKLGTVFQGL
jgi:hypothetical protein